MTHVDEKREAEAGTSTLQHNEAVNGTADADEPVQHIHAKTIILLVVCFPVS